MSSIDSAAPPIVTIVGERIALGPLDHTLVPLMQRWHNDLAVVAALGLPPRPLTLERMAARHDALAAAEDEARFAVYTWADRRPIGLATLPAIDFRHGTARYVLFIGKRDCRGKGYGTETTRLMLEYAADWQGKHVVAVGRWFPSSKTCGVCGHAHAGLTLKDRVWTCPACGATHDQDAKAARTLLAEGTRLFALHEPGATGSGFAGTPRAGILTATIVAAGSPET